MNKSIDFDSSNYKKYLKQQIDCENSFLYMNISNYTDYKNHLGNDILIKMVQDLNIKGIALDVGCNCGYHTEQLKQMIGCASGIDINTQLIERAHQYGRPQCIYGDIHNIPFSGNVFDLIFAHEVLEHSINIDIVLSEINRVLKNNGFLVFSMPCEGHWKQSQDFDILDKHNFDIIDTHPLKITVNNMVKKLLENNFKKMQCQVRNLDGLNTFVEFKNQLKFDFRPHLFGIFKKNG